MNDSFKVIDALADGEKLDVLQYQMLIEAMTPELAGYAADIADKVRRKIYGTDVYIRGLIEVGNVCRNDCFYCGIRKSNSMCERYVLANETILNCCAEGYKLGFRTFVLQGGEDAFFTDGVMCGIISHIKEDFPDCAVGCGAYYCRRSCKGLVRNKK